MCRYSRDRGRLEVVEEDLSEDSLDLSWPEGMFNQYDLAGSGIKQEFKLDDPPQRLLQYYFDLVTIVSVPFGVQGPEPLIRRAKGDHVKQSSRRGFSTKAILDEFAADVQNDAILVSVKRVSFSCNIVRAGPLDA